MTDDEAAWQQVEELSRQLHEIYQAEAKRQDDSRHPDDYDALPEHTKEYDRVLARFILARENAQQQELDRLRQQAALAEEPIRMILYCPSCHALHLDEGEWATKPHRTHRCLVCGNEWRPSLRDTVGVEALQQQGGQ